MHEMNILKYLDGRKHRNADVFQKVSTKLAEAGFQRTVEQIRCRWKALYYKTKKHNNTSGSDPQRCPFYDEWEKLLGHRPLSSIDENAVDIGFEDPPADVQSTSTSSNTGKLTCWLSSIYFIYQ